MRRDLVLRALLALDEQRGSRLAEKYLEGLNDTPGGASFSVV